MTRPRDVEVIVPPDWWPIDLEPERTEASAKALVDRQWRGRDDLPHLKAELVGSLVDEARRARENGGVQLWLCLQVVGPLPLPASLLVTVVPATDAVPSGGGNSDVLEAVRYERSGRGDGVSWVELRLGRALRSRGARVSLAQPTAGERGEGTVDVASPPSTVLDFHVPIPESEMMLLLSFSTPLPTPELVDGFCEVFDAIAGAARWVR